VRISFLPDADPRGDVARVWRLHGELRGRNKKHRSGSNFLGKINKQEYFAGDQPNLNIICRSVLVKRLVNINFLMIILLLVAQK
jgi:hypothetical protein